MKPELKKLLILNAPYLLFVYLFDKIGQAVRLAPGADLSGKVLSLADGFSAAFATPLPSLAPMDLLIGIVGAVLIRLMVYFKGKNAKKYRKGIEYGSARWGAYTLSLNTTRLASRSRVARTWRLPFSSSMSSVMKKRVSVSFASSWFHRGSSSRISPRMVPSEYRASLKPLCSYICRPYTVSYSRALQVVTCPAAS